MSVIVSPNERSKVKDKIADKFEAPIPFDFLIYTEKFKIGLERKRFPKDLLDSLKDGRLTRECAAIRETCDFGIIILEGKGKYNKSGELIYGNHPSGFTRVGVRNLFRSIRYVEGMDIEFTASVYETAELLQEVEQYFNNKHLSTRKRKGIMAELFTPMYQERLLHFYQGLPGISINLATEIAKVYPSPISFITDGREKWVEIKGVGQHIADRIHYFLQGVKK